MDVDRDAGENDRKYVAAHLNSKQKDKETTLGWVLKFGSVPSEESACIAPEDLLKLVSKLVCTYVTRISNGCRPLPKSCMSPACTDPAHSKLGHAGACYMGCAYAQNAENADHFFNQCLLNVLLYSVTMQFN